MMTRSIVVCALLLAALAADAQDVRDVSWGDCQAAVEAAEGEPQRRRPGRLDYARELLGVPARLVYLFEEDRLTEAGYQLQSAEVWDRLVSALTRKYGTPTVEQPLMQLWAGERTVIVAYNNLDSIMLIYTDRVVADRQRQRWAAEDEEQL